jgi:hypothetical protein
MLSCDGGAAAQAKTRAAPPLRKLSRLREAGARNGLSETGTGDMKLERFKHLLDTHGADLERWPAARRRQAEELLAESPEAIRLWRKAAQLDDLLGKAEPRVTAASIERVMAALANPPLRGPRPAMIGARFGRGWAPTALLGGMALLGFVVGASELVIDRGATEHSDLVSIVLSPGLVAGLGL